MNKSSIMKYSIIQLLTFLFCIILSNQTTAQNVNKNSKFDRNKWEKIAEKYDYSKEVKAPQEKQKKAKNQEQPKLELKPEVPLTGLNNFFKYSLFVIVILILVYIGYRLIKNGNLWDNKKIEKPKVYTIENLEENLTEVDVLSFLDQALSKNDYRLAVRLLYLNIIKEMSMQEFIHWKKDKTNGEYLKELSKTMLYNDFRKCTQAYEYVWFNELDDFDQLKFNQVKPDFDNLLGIVNNSTKKTA